MDCGCGGEKYRDGFLENILSETGHWNVPVSLALTQPDNSKKIPPRL
jgi:hypothetical protein